MVYTAVKSCKKKVMTVMMIFHRFTLRSELFARKGTHFFFFLKMWEAEYFAFCIISQYTFPSTSRKFQNIERIHENVINTWKEHSFWTLKCAASSTISIIEQKYTEIIYMQYYCFQKMDFPSNSSRLYINIYLIARTILITFSSGCQIRHCDIIPNLDHS